MPFKTQKFEFTEIVVPPNSTSSRYNFPDLPKLRYTALQAIETYIVTDKGPGDLSYSPLGNPIMPLSVILSSYLVLYINERQDAYRIPLVTIHRTQSTNQDVENYIPFVRPLFEFNNQKVTWDKSYVELGNISAISGIGQQSSFVFGIYYA
jgi:hypothetical protein